MRRPFLASTALIAVTSAASAAEITISGNVTFNYSAVSDSTVYGAGKDGNAMAISEDLTVSSSATSDSGLTYTASIDAADLTETVMTVTGDFGTLKFQEDGGGDGDAAAISGDVAADETTGLLATGGLGGPIFDGDEVVDGGVVSYSSPSISGANIYLGYSDDGAENEVATTSYGIKYATEAAGAKVTLGYAASSEDDGVDARSLGAKIETGGFALTIASNTADHSDNTSEEYQGTSVGLTYSVNDNLAIQMHSKSAENSKITAYDYSENAVSATYTIAPGLTSAITYTKYDYTNNADTKQKGSATNLELKVAF